MKTSIRGMLEAVYRVGAMMPPPARAAILSIRTRPNVPLLDQFAAPPNGIYAVFPHAKHQPPRVRLWLDFLKQNYARPEFWISSR